MEIASPLALLYNLHASKCCVPLESLNTILINKQIEIIEEILYRTQSAKHDMNPTKIASIFIENGMSDLSEAQHAFDFYSIYCQYERDVGLIHGAMAINRIADWNPYQMSRSLIIPITNLNFGHQCSTKAFYAFINDFFLFITAQKYSFKQCATDFAECDHNVDKYAVLISNKINSTTTHKDVSQFLLQKWIPIQFLAQSQRFFKTQSIWKLLLRQKILPYASKPSYFAQNELVKNILAPHANLYANLKINYEIYKDHRQNNLNKMAFLILWPNIKSADSMVNFTKNHLTSDGMIWYQTSSPIEGDQRPQGYQSIFVPYPNSQHGKNGCFCGMKLNAHANTQSLMDGIYNPSWWWYAVGTTTPYKDSYIPGPMIHSSGIHVKHTEFYILDINVALHKYARSLSCLSSVELGNAIFLIIADCVYDYRNIITDSLCLLHPLEDDID
eukprot:866212_1